MTELMDHDNLTLKVQDLTNEVNTLYEMYPNDYPVTENLIKSTNHLWKINPKCLSKLIF